MARTIGAAALGMLIGGAAAAPAMARPKDRPTEIAMTDAFRLAARAAEAAIASGDLTGGAAQVAALQPANPLETYVAAGLRMEVASRRGDPQAQRKALTDMLDSKGVPAGQEPYLRYLAGYYSYYLAEFNDAIAQVSYARQLGYKPVETTVLLADANLKKGNKAEGLALMTQAMDEQRASGKPIPASWFDRAAAFSYQLGNWGDVAKWYQQKLALYPSAANWRSSLVNYLAAPGMDAQVQLDLFRLQAATGAMASERDYQAYAALAAGSGYEAEAKTVIEAGRSNGDLTSAETVTASLLKTVTPKAAKTIASLPAQVKKAAAAPTGAAALAVGDLYFSLGQYPQAAEQYRLALTKGGVDIGRVNSRLGVALARSGDLPGAKVALALADGNWANVSRFWGVWVDQQAKVNSAAQAAPGAPPAS